MYMMATNRNIKDFRRKIELTTWDNAIWLFLFLLTSLAAETLNPKLTIMTR